MQLAKSKESGKLGKRSKLKEGNKAKTKRSQKLGKEKSKVKEGRKEMADNECSQTGKKEKGMKGKDTPAYLYLCPSCFCVCE